jgi:hypothetical protein
VTACDCIGIYNEFLPNETCAALDPQCVPCPPLAPPEALVIETVGPDAILTWNAVIDSFEFCPEPDYYLVFFEEEMNENPDFLAYTADTSFVHPGVAQFSSQMFYHVESYVGSVGVLAGIAARKERVTLEDFHAMIHQ